MVFDRGMVSEENLKHLEKDKCYLYITALDKDQIAGVENVNLDRFKTITCENAEKEILSKSLNKYDDSTFFEDLGMDSRNRHHILVFNSTLLKNQRKAREELIEKGKKELEDERNLLLNARKSRNRKTTEQRINEKLEKLKVHGYLNYELESISLSKKDESTISSFDLTYDLNVEAVEKAMLTDGFWMLVTNITENTEPPMYRLSPEELICAYRDKNRIEEAFRDIKSFINFQPTFVFTDEHVRAHYTICILSYLLDMTVTNKLREKPIEGAGSMNKVYRLLGRCEVGKMSVSGTDCRGLKLMSLTEEQKTILKLFNCNYLVKNDYLKSVCVTVL